MITITIISARDRMEDEAYVVQAVPRIGDLIRTRKMAAARVHDVTWDLASGEVSVYAK